MQQQHWSIKQGMFRQCYCHRIRYAGFTDRFNEARSISNVARRLQAGLSVLAIETSCDDSSVAVLTLNGSNGGTSCEPELASVVNFHRTVTADSGQYNGIHPLVALTSHHAQLAGLVQTACQHMRSTISNWQPSIIAATRGPGMRSNLGVGLSVAKGLAVAWNRPLLGVHHMQAHALTPRLCWTLEENGKMVNKPSRTWQPDVIEPQFPYLTVLVSGGHTMLLQSKDLCEHKILAETQDIAIGDCLDKAARAILPIEKLKAPYGRALEQFAFPKGETDYNYVAPRSRAEEMREYRTSWSWTLPMPLQDKGGEKTSRRMIFSYAGLLSQVVRLMQPELHSNKAVTRTSLEIHEAERRDMAREVLRVSFEHLVSRILLHLLDRAAEKVDTIVVSGGVASNKYLRHVLRQMLDARGFEHVSVIFPPVELCTDNALMIAWAALEMYANGYTTDLNVEPLRKWSMDSNAVDGGILGASGWHRMKIED